MAKTKADLSLEGHRQGDADGRGMIRGSFVAFGIEIMVAILYGVLLHFGIWQ